MFFKATKVGTVVKTTCQCRLKGQLTFDHYDQVSFILSRIINNCGILQGHFKVELGQQEALMTSDQARQVVLCLTNIINNFDVFQQRP